MQSIISNCLNVKSGAEWHPESALEVLPKAGVGMLVIFAVIGLIILVTVILGKISVKKQDSDK